MLPPPPQQRKPTVWWWISAAVGLHVAIYFMDEPRLLILVLVGLATAAWIGAAISAQSIVGRVVLWIPVVFLASWWLFVIIPPWLEASQPFETDLEANSLQAASCVGLFDGANEAGDLTSIEIGLVECVTDSSHFDELFLGVDENTVSSAYCGFYALFWDDRTHGTEGDFTTFVELTLACDTGWTSPPSEYEAAIEQRARILLGEGATAFVSTYSDSPAVIEQHGHLLLP